MPVASVSKTGVFIIKLPTAIGVNKTQQVIDSQMLKDLNKERIVILRCKTMIILFWIYYGIRVSNVPLASIEYLSSIEATFEGYDMMWF